MKILDLFHQHGSKMFAISYVKGKTSYKVTLNDDGVVRNVEISRESLVPVTKQYMQKGKHADISYRVLIE